ncbi:MAG: 4-diphosphocytidyl-2-C-methyl-D-erythritol kinase [Bacteroidia bacterium]|nr:MAG: 4-diphosphocytidyl-2-C-methyl-D-erythritol kinase [Bacteroidia bacterium]
MSVIEKKCYCKINLGLFIKGKRLDGYHEIETLMVPVQNFYDTLKVQIIPSNTFEFIQSGIPIDVPVQENIIYKTWKIIKSELGIEKGIKVELEKNIPIGSGLGGGSSNAAQMLFILNELFQLNIEQNTLLRIARILGADVPFFLKNQPLIARGIGDEFEEIDFPFPYDVKIIVPPFGSNTKKAYQSLNLKECSTHKDLKSILLGDRTAWKNHLINDFEKPLFKKFPELASIKKGFYEAGAFYASMTGSGSAVYGLFEKK